MENNFIQMATLAGHAVAYTIAPIFKHIIDCVIMIFKVKSQYFPALFKRIYKHIRSAEG